MPWPWPWPSQMRSAPNHWGFTVLDLSAVLAVFIGMVHTVNLIFWLSLERSATVFAVRSVAALCSLLVALTIVVVGGRQPFGARRRAGSPWQLRCSLRRSWARVSNSAWC